MRDKKKNTTVIPPPASGPAVQTESLPATATQSRLRRLSKVKNDMTAREAQAAIIDRGDDDSESKAEAGLVTANNGRRRQVWQ